MEQPASDSLRRVDLTCNAGFLGVTLTALAAVYFLGLAPLDRSLHELRGGIEEARELYERRTEVATLRQALLKQQAIADQSLAAMLHRMPTAPRESDFLAQICKLAKESGMTVVDYHPGATETRAECEEMQVRVSARGDYQSLSRFMAEVHNLPRLCRLTQMEVLAPTVDHELSIEMTYGIFFAPESDTDRTVAQRQ